MTWRCYIISSFHFWYFLFRMNRKKERLDEKNFHQSYSNEVLLWKLLDHRYVQGFFSTIKTHTDSSNSEILYSWRFNGNGSTCVLILSWLITIKQKLMKMPTSKMSTTISLVIICFFFSRTKRILTFKLVLIK